MSIPSKLGDAILGLKAMKFRGINCTIPHKIEVLKYIDKLSPSAKLIGAVNTIINDNGMLTGENTDGKGFMIALESAGSRRRRQEGSGARRRRRRPGHLRGTGPGRRPPPDHRQHSQGHGPGRGSREDPQGKYQGGGRLRALGG